MELGIPSSGATFVAALDVLPLFELAEVFFLFHFGNDAVAQLADSGGKDSCFYTRRMIIINNIIFRHFTHQHHLQYYCYSAHIHNFWA